MNKKQITFHSFSKILVLIATLFVMGCNNSKSTFEELPVEEQLKVLNINIENHPKDASLYATRGDILLQLNRVNEAINDYKQATDLEPKNESYQMKLGDAYFANGDVEHSYQTFETVISHNQDNTEAYLKLGEIAFYSRDYDRAIENLGKVTAKDPDNRTALFMKGFICKETGDTTNAVRYLRKVCDQYPDYEPAFEELGTLYAIHQNPLAEEYLSTALKLESQNINAIYSLAMYYQDKQNMEAAEQFYDRILEIDPNHPDAWHNKGWIELFYYGDYDLAIEYFTHAVTANNQFVEAYTNKGCAYELKGDLNNAKICFQTALNIDPNFQPAIKGLGRVR